ncbi:hypothetical protein BLNAU_15774 [Blattamonas nauphoetae]|uniref:Uncharacterized protein n=1 Tax=Blattamonas nauphoetae TaxID=2049346 RepID=A0ABQ9XDF2_9EUKA|nr:hypothetical protein BLNAU_15774 [Blattamonas nauphoetae]
MIPYFERNIIQFSGYDDSNIVEPKNDSSHLSLRFSRREHLNTEQNSFSKHQSEKGIRNQSNLTESIASLSKDLHCFKVSAASRIHQILKDFDSQDSFKIELSFQVLLDVFDSDPEAIEMFFVSNGIDIVSNSLQYINCDSLSSIVLNFLERLTLSPLITCGNVLSTPIGTVLHHYLRSPDPSTQSQSLRCLTQIAHCCPNEAPFYFSEPFFLTLSTLFEGAVRKPQPTYDPSTDTFTVDFEQDENLILDVLTLLPAVLDSPLLDNIIRVFLPLTAFCLLSSSYVIVQFALSLLVVFLKRDRALVKSLLVPFRFHHPHPTRSETHHSSFLDVLLKLYESHFGKTMSLLEQTLVAHQLHLRHLSQLPDDTIHHSVSGLSEIVARSPQSPSLQIQKHVRLKLDIAEMRGKLCASALTLAAMCVEDGEESGVGTNEVKTLLHLLNWTISTVLEQVTTLPKQDLLSRPFYEDLWTRSSESVPCDLKWLWEFSQQISWNVMNGASDDEDQLSVLRVGTKVSCSIARTSLFVMRVIATSSEENLCLLIATPLLVADPAGLPFFRMVNTCFLSLSWKCRHECILLSHSLATRSYTLSALLVTNNVLHCFLRHTWSTDSPHAASTTTHKHLLALWLAVLQQLEHSPDEHSPAYVNLLKILLSQVMDTHAYAHLLSLLGRDDEEADGIGLVARQVDRLMTTISKSVDVLDRLLMIQFDNSVSQVIFSNSLCVQDV